MDNQKTTKTSLRLLKCNKSKNGHIYHNLYLQVNDGNPISIKLTYDNIKVRNLLLAIAEQCEIKTTTIVRPIKEEEF